MKSRVMWKFLVYFQWNLRNWVITRGTYLWRTVGETTGERDRRLLLATAGRLHLHYVYLKNSIHVSQLFYFHTVFYNSNLYKIIYNFCNVNTFYITNISIVYIHTHAVAKCRARIGIYRGGARAPRTGLAAPPALYKWW